MKTLREILDDLIDGKLDKKFPNSPISIVGIDQAISEIEKMIPKKKEEMITENLPLQGVYFTHPDDKIVGYNQAIDEIKKNMELK